MQLLLLRASSQKHLSVDLGKPHAVLLLSAILFSLVFLPFFLGYSLSRAFPHASSPPEPSATAKSDSVSPWIWQQREWTKQRADIDNLRNLTQKQIDALAVHLGKLQAQSLRLDALGDRLVKKIGLRNSEFDFGNVPALGGPSYPCAGSLGTPDFLAAVDQLSAQFEDRERQLQILERLLTQKQSIDQTAPTGMPVAGGWISSGFGERPDPVTGQMIFHEGVDIPGKEGAPIYAVAGGVVSFSGQQAGYGNLVEIDHPGNYVTRYAHNAENLVEVGEVIQKGQKIGLLGSSGRTTGAHLHFEVRQAGEPVDPVRYVKILGGVEIR